MAKKHIVFTVESRIQEMVEKIKEKNGYSTFTQVWQQAMIEFHAREFKDYVQSKAKREPTAEERVERETEVRDAKKKARENEKLEIVKKLGGRVIGTGDNKIVKWFTYWTKGKDEQEMPLTSLTAELVQNQFNGNMKTIKKFHKLK